MVPPETPPAVPPRTDIKLSLAATGWAACFALWLLAIAAVALFGDGGSMAYAALIALFAGGVLIALMALVVVPLIRSLGRGGG